MEFRFSPHAVDELQERGIPLQVVMIVLNHPDEILEERKGRMGYQSTVDINGKPYVVRVIVEPDGTIVTVYRTSKVKKYRSAE